MVKYKRRLMVFGGATLIEIVVAKLVAPYLGVPAQTPIWQLIVIANIATAFFVDYIYKKHK